MAGMDWYQVICRAFTNLGGYAFLSDLYCEIERIHPRQLSPSFRSIVRNILQTHSSDVRWFNPRNHDAFCHIDRGVWGLRD